MSMGYEIDWEHRWVIFTDMETGKKIDTLSFEAVREFATMLLDKLDKMIAQADADEEAKRRCEE